LILIFLLLVFLKFTEIEKIVALFRQVKPFWFLMAILMQVLTYAFTAAVYYSLLHLYQEKSCSFGELFKASVVSLFVSQAIPTAGVSGSSYLAYYFNRKGLAAHKSLSVVILQVFTYFLVHLIVLAGGFFFLFFFLHQALSRTILSIGVLGAVLYIALNIIVLFFGSRRTFIFLLDRAKSHAWLDRLLKKLKLESPLAGLSRQDWQSAWDIIKGQRQRLLLPLLWQLMVILTDAGTIYCLFLGFSFRTNFFVVLIGLMLTKVVEMVSFTPGSLVFFEGAMVLFYNSFAVPLQLAVVSTLLFRALSFWLPMPFGLVMYREASQRLRRDYSPPYSFRFGK
jgi:uncharacterized protein (TIRG00374 family)